MRILFLSQLVPFPPDAGPKVRSYYVLRYLVSVGHEVTLVCFSRAGDLPESIDYLRSICRAVYTVPIERSRYKDIWYLGRSLLGQTPFLIARDNLRNMRRFLEGLLATQGFDAIHVDQLWMAQHGLHAKKLLKKQGSDVKLVLDQHNAVHLIPQRLAKGESLGIKRKLLEREARLMKQYETQICRRCDSVVWVTDEDRRTIYGSSKNQNNDFTIPICVDPYSAQVINRPAPSNEVTFFGGLHWPPNAEGIAWFIDHVWPIVLSNVSEVHLTVIGKDPPEALLRNNRLGSNIKFTGYVEDPLPYMKKTGAFIVPLHSGGGMRVKIIDAWSWGLPVVSTTIGAEGIKYEDGKDLLIADGEEAFAEAVLRLLQEPHLATNIGKTGRYKVEKEYDWRSRYRAWDQVYSL
jgi:polysaccharide biosynthesis protein PslH